MSTPGAISISYGSGVRETVPLARGLGLALGLYFESQQQETPPMARSACLIQCQEDHPHNPGWWRFGRPVLRHLKPEEVPNLSEHNRVLFARGMADAREAQRAWDRANPRG